MPSHDPGPLAIVAIEGPSGVGKSTVATALADRWGAPLLREAYDRLTPRPSLEWRSRSELLRIESRLFREEVRRYREAVRLRKSGVLVVADTGFAGPLTYSLGLVPTLPPAWEVMGPLLRVARAAARDGRWGLPDVLVYIVAPLDVIHRRVTGDPTGHPPDLLPRHLQVAERERRFWQRAAREVPSLHVRLVSATGSVGAVVDRVEFAAHPGLRHPTPGARVVDRLLGLLERSAPLGAVRVKRRGRSARPSP